MCLPFVLPQPDCIVRHIGDAAVLALEACAAGACPFLQPGNGRFGAFAQPSGGLLQRGVGTGQERGGSPPPPASVHGGTNGGSNSDRTARAA
eukprot:12721663-Alexandrium_andersonii.AAC.1